MANDKNVGDTGPDPDPSDSAIDDPRLADAGSSEWDLPPATLPDPVPASGEPEEEDGEPGQFYRATTDPDLHEPYVAKERVKVRRKNQKSVPDWEREEGAEEEESSKRRRRRKNHKPTLAEKLFLKSSKILFGTLITFGVAIAAFAIYAFVNTLGGSGKALESSEQAARQAELTPSETEGLLPNFVTEEATRRAEETLNSYFGAATWEEKVAFVRHPDRVRPLMEEWYARPENLGTAAPTKISEIGNRKQVPIGGRVFVMLAVMLEPDHRMQFCTVEKLAGGDYKVDWEVTEGYQPMSRLSFQTSQPTRPTPFRVFVRNGDYYNAPFDAQDRYRCFALSDPRDPNLKLWAYIERGTPLESQMDTLVPPLTGTSLILDLQFPDAPASDDQVIISGVNHPNWFY